MCTYMFTQAEPQAPLEITQQHQEMRQGAQMYRQHTCRCNGAFEFSGDCCAWVMHHGRGALSLL